MLPSGSILFSSRAPIGHCAVLEYPACTNQGFKSIVPNERLDPVYGFFVLKFLTRSIIAKGRGATFAEINKELMEEIRIPYCNLAAQRQIAIRLKRADHLRGMRRHAIEMCDELRLNSFREMLNKCRKTPAPLGELCKKITDGVHITPTYVVEGVPFLRVTDIQDDEIDWPSVKRIPQKEYAEITRRVRAEIGDILYSKNGTIGIAKEVMWQRPFAHFVSLALLKPKRDLVNSTFLTSWLNTPEALQQATGHSKTLTVTNLHLNEIEKISVPLPLVKDQQKLVALIESANKLCAINVEAFRQADHLFQTLLYQAFAN